jgi:glycerophosphoryl diester phosphodiesterase
MKYLMPLLRLAFFSLLSSVLLLRCEHFTDPKVPQVSWSAFDTLACCSFTADLQQKLEGVYTVEEGKGFWGPAAVAQWSYTVNGRDTVHHLSFFFEEESGYLICEGRQSASGLFLKGYWRKIVNTETGTVALTISPPHNGDVLISGTYGIKSNKPEKPLQMRFRSPLHNKDSLEIIAHRGGGRNNDLLPASENSLELIKMAARFGATGVELDVKLTKDGVPVLYHDAQVNDRLTTKAGIRGSISDYTFEELHTTMSLKRGGKIPTLEQALDTILNKTPLRFVWLDTKYEGSLEKVRALQQAYLRKGEGGRRLNIVIGVPDEKVLKHFRSLPDHTTIPSLTELDTAQAVKMGAGIWAPSWTKGQQNETVRALQGRGKKVFVWTLDAHSKIEEFLEEAHFNGIVTNRPSMVAYYYYTR